MAAASAFYDTFAAAPWTWLAIAGWLAVVLYGVYWANERESEHDQADY